MAIEKNLNSGGLLELPSKQHCCASSLKNTCALIWALCVYGSRILKELQTAKPLIWKKKKKICSDSNENFVWSYGRNLDGLGFSDSIKINMATNIYISPMTFRMIRSKEVEWFRSLVVAYPVSQSTTWVCFASSFIRTVLARG